MKKGMRKMTGFERFISGVSVVLIIITIYFIGASSNLGLELQELTVQKHELQGEIDLLKEELAKPVEPDWVGYASWYGEADDECIGCRADRIMANGRVFDEGGLTVAFNRASLGTMLKIRNPFTGQGVVVEVTDTGGFEPLGRIIDLSKGVKEAIGCTDLCYVEIYR